MRRRHIWRPSGTSWTTTTPTCTKTSDYGKTWHSIAEGFPGDEFTRVIREDPARPGLLYAGTETGVHVSFDDGRSWQSLQVNLPPAPIHDLTIKDGDLIAATHGRSFWILDDLTLLHQLGDGGPREPVHLFRPGSTCWTSSRPGTGRPAVAGKSYQVGSGAPAAFRETRKPGGETVRTFLDAGVNPPEGVVVTYHLMEKPEGEISLTFLDASGQEVKTLSSAAAEEGESSDAQKGPRVPAEAGLNRFVWDMRYADARKVSGDVTTERSLTGPLAAPGEYQVRLTVAGETYSESFEILKDPRVKATQQDLDEQLALLIRIGKKLSETQDAINQLRNVRQQVEEWVSRAEGSSAGQAMSAAGSAVKGKLSPIEEQLVQTRALHARDTLNLPSRLNAKMAALTSVVASADGAPTRQSYEVFDDLSGRIDRQLGALQRVVDEDVAAFINLVHELEVPAIVPKTQT